jgi:hypothetical protein
VDFQPFEKAAFLPENPRIHDPLPLKKITRLITPQLAAGETG